MAACDFYPASEEYADFIVRYVTRSPENLIELARTECVNFITASYAIVHARLDRIEPMSIYRYSYPAIPKLYGLLDTTALESSGIPPVIENPSLQANGRDVIIGIIDTGIDYTSPLFRHPDGSSRIISLWDQSVPAGAIPEPISGFQPFYGSVYNQEQLNEALASPDPYQLVPSRDTNGHGTFLAGVAAGNSIRQPLSFSGAAPEADLAIIKLKPAKQYLRDFYLIPPEADAYQENDIMSAVSFLNAIAVRYLKPLVILLGLGTNQGAHDGTAPLGNQLQNIYGIRGLAAVAAAGNEVGYHHHFMGNVSADQPYEEVELRVASDERGFCVELWSGGPETYTVGFISPSGETIDPIQPAIGKEIVVPFRLDSTEITVNYQSYETGSGNQLIFMRFQAPSQGIWRIRVYCADLISGHFHLWLPMHGFLSDETVFLRPDPNITITDPGNVPAILTVGAYNHENNSIYIHSSRGYSSSGQIKPDLTAPGVDVQGPSVSGRTTVPADAPALAFTRRTGTSVAAAIAAGAVADIFTWAITDRNDEALNGTTARSMLIQGADRNPAFTWPNREWGYGSLNLFRAFTAGL